MKKPAHYLFPALFLFNLAWIIASWWTAPSLISLGRLAGLLAEYLLLVELVLIGRIGILERTYGFAGMNRIHRLIGKYLLLLILAHPVLLTVGYARGQGISFTEQFLDFILNWEHVALAAVGLAIFILAISLSYGVIRRRLRYETWYFTHLAMYVAIGLVFVHQMGAGNAWLALNFSVFGLVLGYRLGRPLWLTYKHRFIIQEVVSEGEGVISLIIGGRRMDEFKFEPGQYCNMTLLSRKLWMTHPFSFSMAPNGKTLRFTIKSLGDFTSNIGTVKSGTRVILDGPLGLFTPSQAVTDKFLLIGGGVGITPMRAMAEQLAGEKKDAAILYCARDEESLILKNELKRLEAGSSKGGRKDGRISVTYFLESLKTPHESYEPGRIDEVRLKRLVPDFARRDAYVCGPPAMMNAVNGILLSLGVPKQQIHLEQF